MAFFTGTPGDDTRDAYGVNEATQRNDYDGREGNDRLAGGDEGDQLTGGDGNDTLEGRGGEDQLTTGDGEDAAYGGAGDDAIYYRTGNKTLIGDRGDDIFEPLSENAGSRLLISGGAGDDFVRASLGADLFDGGVGEDVIDYRDITAGVTVNLQTGKGGGAAAGDTYRFVENVDGTDFADRIVGDGARNVISGQRGDDTISGGAAGDYLDGGFGAFDLLDYAGSDAGVTIDLAAGSTFGGDAQGDSIFGFEAVNGTAFRDVLNGSSDANRLVGQAGADSLAGKAGADTLSGGVGDDNLLGGAGLDKLSGGTGADRFLLTLATDSSAAAAGRDQILDFSRAQGDRIDVSGVDADSQAAGDQTFAFIGTAAFSGASGQLRVVRSGDDVVAFGDVNGDRVADFGIAVLDVPSLAAADFVL